MATDQAELTAGRRTSRDAAKSRAATARRPGARPALSSEPDTDWRAMLRYSIARVLARTGALILGVLALAGTLALVSHDPGDTAFSTAGGALVSNWAGSLGAYGADSLLFLFGLPGALILPLAGVMAVEWWRGDVVARAGRRLLLASLGAVLLGIGIELWSGGAADSLPAGRGGVAALIAGPPLSALIDGLGGTLAALVRITAIIVLSVAGLALWWPTLRLDRSRWRLPALPISASPSVSRLAAAADGPVNDPDFDEDQVAAPASPQPRAKATPDLRTPPTITVPTATAVLPSAMASASDPSVPAAQGDLLATYVLPPIALLSPAPPSQGTTVDKASLERNARLLESVLEDFQVKGAITAVRPGPVVTMYELEPAPGTRAQRVINLADDIARNMSAQSARIATVQGRTVIGIELPNARREAVVLHEMIASQAFQDQSAGLPIILGKNIAGDPVIADLAPMPHLLIAGTTGSGKSVGLNTMILSLLYRMTPDQCRTILIDPKMLELSVYDGIPHLLAPVVTEPKKAIRALKWAVEQMEDRYRMMSSLSVRNLASFNDKVRAAKAKGASLGRRVQTGHDPDTGLPIYEEEALDYQVLPQVVIVVDELADLMMTAGKEVEFLIQRLAQKARAAGIHLILATQRPSVDVITGVIKANLPTRISFNVTSKIDSRTIIGDSGAEQLLGKGDMLYMSGGRQLTRVHGPFVSDDEVREVADHWRTQGEPAYVDAVTEEPEDGGFALDGAPVGEDSPEDQMYARARQIVIDSQKASTSWLQRQLRIGYNSAARLIDRMEEDGLVSPPNHVGRRDVLQDAQG